MSKVGYDLGDPVLVASLDTGMRAVEERLRAAVKSEDQFIAEASRHLIDAGGKRFRPLLTLLAAHLGDPVAPGVTDSAVVMELTHLATLYHDDVMDEAERRRGADSANSRWGNSVAILTGDFIFARASEISADLGVEAVRIQARTFERLVSGQIRETVGPLPGQDPVDHHISVLADKTGSLIATSARFGAMFAGCDEATVEVVTRYGERIGVAFQIIDDVVDIAADPRESGKTPGTDLREGIKTLPVLLALRSEDPADARLQELLSRPLPDDADHTLALSLLRAHPALAEAGAVARSWACQARDSLTGLPDSSVRSAMARLCEYVITRSG